MALDQKSALRKHTCRQGIEPCKACEDADRVTDNPSLRKHPAKPLTPTNQCGTCRRTVFYNGREWVHADATESERQHRWVEAP